MQNSLSKILLLFALATSPPALCQSPKPNPPIPSPAGVQATTSTDTIIKWDKNRKLTWENYKGKPPLQNPYDAASVIEIDWTAKRVNGKVLFEVYAGFHTKSYTRTESKDVLEHEQLHFDLGEVYARMIRRYIDENFRKIPETPEGVFMMNHYFVSLREMFKSEGFRYDIETNHGLNKPKQAEWKLYIEKMLKELELYDFY